MALENLYFKKKIYIPRRLRREIMKKWKYYDINLQYYTYYITSGIICPLLHTKNQSRKIHKRAANFHMMCEMGRS